MNIVITGAARGIGLELSKIALATTDARVLAVARTPSPALKALADKNLAIAGAEMTDPKCGDKIAAACADWPHIDVLINNAGMYAKGVSADDFIESFRVNSIAPFLITSALLPKLKKSPAAKVVQITSKMGSIQDNSSGGYEPYRASKAALNIINKSLAVDNPWLTTIVMHPGWVRTDMGGSNAPVEPIDSAKGIWKVLQGLKSGDTGKFFDFRGEHIPW